MWQKIPVVCAAFQRLRFHPVGFCCTDPEAGVRQYMAYVGWVCKYKNVHKESFEYYDTTYPVVVVVKILPVVNCVSSLRSGSGVTVAMPPEVEAAADALVA